MDKRFWGFLLLVAVVLGGIFFITNTHKAGAPSSAKGQLTNHVEGKGSTGVKLVEYGDFQCPACGDYYQAVKDTQAKYSDQITFQFRNFPLFQIHPNAIAGARAAEAAAMQNKYWEMHDLLYTENLKYYGAQQQGSSYPTWIDASNPAKYFDTYAASLGLNVTKFDSDYKSTATNDLVQADLAEGNKLNVDSTPTFFLDGKKITNPNPTVDGFSKLIDAEIKKKGGTPTTSTSSQPAADASGSSSTSASTSAQ